MLYPVLEVFLYSVDLFPMLSAVSCLYFFHSCYFCILYLSLLTFLIFVFASFYFLLFFILSSYLFLFFTLQFALLYFCASFRCLFIIAFSLIYGLSFSHFLCILKSSFFKILCTYLLSFLGLCFFALYLFNNFFISSIVFIFSVVNVDSLLPLIITYLELQSKPVHRTGRLLVHIIPAPVDRAKNKPSTSITHEFTNQNCVQL